MSAHAYLLLEQAEAEAGPLAVADIRGIAQAQDAARAWQYACPAGRRRHVLETLGWGRARRRRRSRSRGKSGWCRLARTLSPGTLRILMRILWPLLRERCQALPRSVMGRCG